MPKRDRFNAITKEAAKQREKLNAQRRKGGNLAQEAAVEVPALPVQVRSLASRSNNGSGCKFPYELVKMLGSGSYGEVYKGRKIRSQNAKERNAKEYLVAIKFEPVDTKSKIENEVNCYKRLKGVDGIPACHGHFTEALGNPEKWYNVMVLDLQGKSLEKLLHQCGGQFTPKTICLLGSQMIDRLKTVHNRGLIHRDIKPANFCLGRGKNSDMLYLVDFGLSKQFLVEPNKQHIPHRTGKGLCGTSRYVSLNVHAGTEPSRRDDLTSVGYVLASFRNALPWQGLSQKEDTAELKQQRIWEKKRKTSIKELCKDCPRAVNELLEYCAKLEFAEEPDYNKLIEFMQHTVFFEDPENFTMDFDWMMPNRK